MTIAIQDKCALCLHPLFNHQYHAEDQLFCCKGCQLVYSILQAQQSLDNYQNHPVFKQALHSGLITQPHLQFSKDEENQIPETDFNKLHLVIEEMWCPSCAQVIHLILMKEKGIKSCIVDYSTDLSAIEYTPRLISKEKILQLIKSLGYQPRSLKDPRQESISRSLKLRFIIAVFFSFNIMMFAYPIYATHWHREIDDYANLFAWLSFGGSLPVLFYSGWPIWKRFYSGMKVGIWGMEALVSLGVFSAVVLSLYELFLGSSLVYFDSMSVIIVFVLLGKIIESRAKFSAKDSLLKLSLALPRKGRKRCADGQEIFTPIKDIHSGDLIVVYMGEKIVLDGVVEEGSGSCDESLMTGEAQSIPKLKGSFVLAGTILRQGSLVIRVLADFEETALNRIMDVIGQEVEHKSRYTRAVDPIVKWFVPFVIALAFLTGIVCLAFGIQDGSYSVQQTAIIRLISVLLISCPCAIGIAAPLAEAYVLNTLAKIGVIVRNRGCLTYLGRETVFAFDKTGTVTEGDFKVRYGLEELTPTQKEILKSMTEQSIHPLAFAIHNSLQIPSRKIDRVEEKVGQGIEAYWNENIYTLGSEVFFKEKGINLPDFSFRGSSSIFTVVYFAQNQKCLTALVLEDSVKEGMHAFIQSLNPAKTYLISGDGQKTVEKVAKSCGFQHWIAECRPLQKKEWIDQLKRKGEIVAMIGDGINDAPAITAAHVGVAVVSASDLSIQISDLLLTSKHLNILSQLKKIASLGHRIIKQNIFWAFFYNCIGLVLAVCGLLSPLFAAFAMVISSLIILGNTQRINLK